MNSPNSASPSSDPTGIDSGAESVTLLNTTSSTVDLTGWVLYNCPRSAWEVAGGELRTNGNDGRNGWLLTEAESGDFELRVEFMVFGKANNVEGFLAGTAQYVQQQQAAKA